MGRGACQLGRTAGVEVGEEESGGSIGSGTERICGKGRFVATGAMRELRQDFWAIDAMWEVQSRVLLYADVSGRSLQRAQGRMSSHEQSFKERFGDGLERSSIGSFLVPLVFDCSGLRCPAETIRYSHSSLTNRLWSLCAPVLLGSWLFLQRLRSKRSSRLPR